jgi:S-adenosylmethionine decarboxylase
MLGKHVILDIHTDSNLLTNKDAMCKILSDAAIGVGCTVLFVEGHVFTPLNGYTAVIGLAESHISIHTWPEHNCCAIDIFMCGECNSETAADIILTKMNATDYTKKVIERL